MTTTIIHQQLSDRIIGLALAVYRILGPGLLESAYEEAMCCDGHGCPSVAGRMDAGILADNERVAVHFILAGLITPRRELRHSSIPFERQKVYPLCYKGDYISAYIADLVVDNAVILELKAVQALNSLMEAQLINYLKLSKVPVGYLINFQGIKLEWKRFVCQRSRE